ncbi:MAG: glycosyltransferase [Burkholderiales bacterium]
MTTTSFDNSSINPPLVTAVLVCWNHERFVRAAVLSALQQTDANVQLIVFDNGSTDGSRRELEALRAEHEFTLICQENAGLVKAINRGLALAKGKYLAILATDDIWLPHKTALQAAFMEANPEVAMVSGQVAFIDADGQPMAHPGGQRIGEITFADLMGKGCSVHGPTVMVRIDVLREIGGYDETLRIEDYSMALKLTHDGRRVVVLPDSLTLYRRHGNNWTAKPIDPDIIEIGNRYRDTPEYHLYFRYHFPLTFWRLVQGGKKMQAWRLMCSEPVPWTWANVGRGMVRMLIPYSFVKAVRALQGKPMDGLPLY